ncbi:MAG: hypothetical protein AB2A00_24875 [Myxococcota bacterium]
MAHGHTAQPPGLWQWAFKVAATVGVTSILCCVLPAALFLLGLGGAVYAISFADAFYREDGSPGLGAWLLRALAVAIGIGGVVLYRRRQAQCSVDPARARKNLVLLTAVIAVMATGVYLSLERLTAWYFDRYIVPAQQEELGTRLSARAVQEQDHGPLS